MYTKLNARPRNLACGSLCGTLVALSLPALAAAQTCEWLPMGAGFGTMVHGVGVFDHGSGPMVYAGLSGQGVSRWDGQAWSPAGDLTSGSASAFVVFDDGSGPALYAGGTFSSIGQLDARRVARWDGQAWSRLGDGLNAGVGDMTIFDDGTGPALYVVGGFTTAGGNPANRVAQWDGQNWTSLGDGITGGAFGGGVNAIAAYNGAIYVGGNFTTAGGQPARNIARWDPATEMWSEPDGGASGIVVALGVYDDGAGGGPSLYVGGLFDQVGSVFASRVARWDGNAWWPLSSGVSGGFSTAARAFAVVEDAGRSVLYIGGEFTNAGGIPASNIARWEGDLAGWSAVGDGVSGNVNGLAVDGTTLFVGGAFTNAGGQPALRIARWECEATPEPCYANCDGSTTEPILTVDDFTCFINEFAHAQTLTHEQQVEHYANCDGSTTAPVLTVDDFTCFINAFAQGCP